MVNLSFVNRLLDLANAESMDTFPLVVALVTATARVAERRGLPVNVVVACLCAAYTASAEAGDDDDTVCPPPSQVHVAPLETR